MPTSHHAREEAVHPPGIRRHHLPRHPPLTMIISVAAAVHQVAAAHQGAGNKRN